MGILNTIVYSYLTDVYRNESAVVRLLLDRLAEAEHAILSLDAFLQAVQDVPARRFAHDQTMSACVGGRALLRVSRVLVSQWFCFRILLTLRDMDFYPVLALLVAARGAKVNWDAKPDSSCFLYKFDKEMIPALPASAPLKRVSTSGKRAENGGMPMRSPEYLWGFASRGMSKAYVRKAWKCFNSSVEKLANLPVLDEQDALMAEVEEIVVVEPSVAEVPAIDVDALLAVDEEVKRELKVAVDLFKLERVDVKRKLLELQKKLRSKRLKVLTSVTEAFTLVNKLLGSVVAYTSMAERATNLNCGEELEDEVENLTVQRDGNRQALDHAQVKEIQESHNRDLDALRDSFKACESEFLQERDKRLVEQKPLCIKRDEKSSCYHSVLSSFRRLVHASSISESNLQELLSKLQLLYEDSQKVPVSAGLT